VVLEVYWSLKCPHCLEALPQIEAMAKENPWLRVETREITRSPDNLERFVARAEALGGTAQVVPTLIYCGQMAVGWDDSAAGRESLIGRLRACESGEPASGGTAEPARVAVPFLGEVDPAVLSLPVLTVLLAGLDAFNPCAFFVLLFLLSLLAHQHQRRRMLLIGGVFVSVSGLMYFAFMAAWLNVFLFVGMTETLRIGLAALAMLIGLINVKDFFAFRRGLSLSIPESAKPGLYARARAILKAESLPASLAAVAALAVVVNFVELLCTAGLPAIYTAVLTSQGLSPLAHYGYLGLYCLAYIADDALMVGTAVLALGSGRVTERGGRLLKLLSGGVMLALGVVMLLRPQWLM